MSNRVFVIGTVLLVSAAAATADDKPKLIDENRPLQELRPMDRHTYVLTLEAEWGVDGKEKLRPAKNKTYYVNVFFPDGAVYSHRVLGVSVFANGSDKYLDYPERVERGQAVADPKLLEGEVRCLLPDYQLARHGIAKSGKFSVALSVGDPAKSLESDNVITQPIEITWPLKDRPVQKTPALTRHSPPERPDALPGQP
jgi:hypothetical protein